MDPARIVLVTSSGCHFCEDAKEALEDLGQEFPLVVRVVDAASPEGWALVARHQPALMPLVLLDGERFSIGLFPKKKLRRVLEARAAIQI